MSSSARTTRAMGTRRNLNAGGSVEGAPQINFDERSARLASRTRRLQGATFTRSLQRQLVTMEPSNDGATTPTSPVSSFGSPPHRRRVGRTGRHNQPSNQDAITPVSPLPFGRDVEGDQTPLSDASMEGEEPGRDQDGDGDNATPEGSPTTPLTPNEGPNDGPQHELVSEDEERETENRSSGGSVINFDTTSDNAPEDLTTDTGDATPIVDLSRPSRTGVARKKRRRDQGDVGERVRHLERLLRSLARSIGPKGDGPPSHTSRSRSDAPGATRSNVVLPPQPPASPASWGTIQPLDATNEVASSRDARSPSRPHRRDRQKRVTTAGRVSHDRRQVSDHDVLPRSGRRERRGEPRVSHEDHQEHLGDTLHGRPRRVKSASRDVGTDGWTTSDGDDRTPEPPRRSHTGGSQRAAPAVVLLDDTESEVDSLDSPVRSFDDDFRHSTRRRRPKLKDLSREELIQKLEKVKRRGLATPVVDYMGMFSKYTQDHKIKFNGPQPDRFSFGKELFSEFRDRYQAYALSSGWSSGQQVAAMIRFLDGRPRAIFKEWINEGRLETMDAEVMWRLMKKRFCDPTEERQAARVELAQRIQAKGESLLAYEQIFSEMANRAGLSEEEMVERWVKNIDPEVANVCRTHTAKEDLTFQEVARIARRADRQAPDARTPQVAIKKVVHTVAAVARDIPEDTDDTTTTDVSTRSINAIKDALSRDLRREMATRQLEFDETIGSLKRKLDHMQVMQVQHEPKRRDRKPSPVRNRNRVGGIRLPDGVCIRCGSKDHARCTWKEACEYCKRPGHKDVVCFAKLRDQESRPNKK